MCFPNIIRNVNSGSDGSNVVHQSIYESRKLIVRLDVPIKLKINYIN